MVVSRNEKEEDSATSQPVLLSSLYFWISTNTLGHRGSDSKRPLEKQPMSPDTMEVW